MHSRSAQLTGIAALDLAAAVPPGDAAGGGGRLCPCQGRSQPRRVRARWCTSGASISWNSPSCSSRKSRCGRRGVRSTRAWLRCATRSSSHAPPERPITFAWPDAIHVDGGLVGGGRLAWPQGASETEPPDWLVFGASVRTVAMGEEEAGLRPLVAALDEEGFDDLGSGRLVESFARHLMVALDAWRANEFATVTQTYLQHLTIEKGAIPALRRQRRPARALARPGRSPTGTILPARCACHRGSTPQREGRAR